ncbi:MAG: hypothetical protein QG635_1873 [Bacteroidota bacterium]|nr:hypothetical protein [Bacteroidota bacterium]
MSYEIVENPEEQLTQSSRIAALDLARLLAMLMMIQGHTMYELAQPTIIDINNFPWDIWNYIRGVTAPVFLMISGAVHVFANKRDSSGFLSNKIIIKRIRMAFMLIAIGYMLLFPVQKVYDLLYIDFKYWQVFLQVNILQCLGISLLLLTGIFLLARKDQTLMKASLVIALLISFATPIIGTISWSEYIPEFFAAYLTQEHGSIFPIFPFTSYLFFGVALGLLLKKIRPDRRVKWLIRFGIPIGLMFFSVGFPVQYIFGHYILDNIPNSPNLNPGVVLVRVGFVLSGLSVISIIYEKTKRLKNIYSFFSKRAIYIYLVHLLVIYGTPIFPGFAYFFGHSLDLGGAVLSVAVVEILTISAVFSIDLGLKKFPRFKDLFRYSITAYLIYLFFI